MSFNKIWLRLHVFLFIFFIVLIATVLMKLENKVVKSMNKPPLNIVKIATDTPQNYFKKYIYSDMDTYNKLVDSVDDFLYLLRENDYEAAYLKINPDYLKYKSIDNQNKFKDYISLNGYDNASFNIIEYSKYDRYSDEEVYFCKVVTFTANIGDEYEDADEYLRVKKEGYDTFVVYCYEDNYNIAFEGFVSMEEYQNTVTIDNNVLSFIPILKYNFDNKTVYEINFKNISSFDQNPSDMIFSIVAEDTSSNFYWADSLPNTKEYELTPGENKNYFINIKHGDLPLSIVTISFVEEFALKSIIF